MNDVIFIKSEGGLGRTSPEQDYISGIAFYDAKFKDNTTFTTNGVTTFTATNRIIKFNRLSDFEKIGITSTNALTKEYWYQVSEYFRITGNADLYVGLFNDTVKESTPVALTFNEAYLMQIFAQGEIRQFGVYNTKNIYASGDVEKVQAIATLCTTEHMPASFIYGSNIKATSDLTTLASLKTLSTVSPNVSVVIAQDGAGVGSTLYTSEGTSIPAVGATLGLLSNAMVQESIAWILKFNIASGGELEVPAFGNGTLVSSLSTSVLNQINALGYLFLKKHVGISGTYLNDNHTADKTISDYAYITEVRTIDKAIRGVRTKLLPYLNSPIKISSTGQIASSTIEFFKSITNNYIDKMIGAGELSAGVVEIDSNQNILVTSKLQIVIRVIPYGTARQIEVTIGYVVSL